MKNTQKYAAAAFSMLLGGVPLASVLSPQHKVETQIDIAASSDRVWVVLTDTTAYPSWNPFIRELAGQLAVGQRLTVSLGGGGMVFHPKIVTVLPRQRLQWIGRLWGLPGLFTGTHDFEIIPTNHGTLFRQSEAFSGVLLWFYDVETVRTEFTKMNQALKTRVEAP
jgi:hypothetical protein